MAVHSKNTYINLDGVDISNYCNDCSVDDAADEVEVTGFGHTTKQYVSGFRDVSGSLAGNWGENDGTGLVDQLTELRDSGEVVPLIYGPAGDGAGNVKLLYDAIVLSFNTSSSIGGAVTFSANLRLQNPTVGAFS